MGILVSIETGDASSKTIRNRIDPSLGRIELIHAWIGSILARIDPIEIWIDWILARMGSIQTRIDSNQNWIGSIRNRLHPRRDWLRVSLPQSAASNALCGPRRAA
jgi:hypothetical protein